jgi:hypothetical protein
MPSRDSTVRTNFDLNVTIAVGQTVSSAVDLYGTALVGFITDANLTGTALTFQGSDSLAGTYKAIALLSTGVNIAGVVTTSKYYILETTINLSAVRFLKIVSGSAQSTNPTVITLITKPIN